MDTTVQDMIISIMEMHTTANDFDNHRKIQFYQDIIAALNTRLDRIVDNKIDSSDPVSLIKDIDEGKV